MARDCRVVVGGARPPSPDCWDTGAARQEGGCAATHPPTLPGTQGPLQQACQLVSSEQKQQQQLGRGTGLSARLQEASPPLGRHLHGLQEQLQQENKHLRNEVDELRIECERLKVSRGP